MGAKARKKEKRRAEHQAQGAAAAAEDAALDAAISIQIAKESTLFKETGDTPTRAPEGRHAITRITPSTLAAVPARRLERKGQAPATDDELYKTKVTSRALRRTLGTTREMLARYY